MGSSVLICHLTRLVGWDTMARLLPVLAALSPYSVFSHNGGVKHVLEGEEYGISSRQDKAISTRGFGNDVAEDNREGIPCRSIEGEHLKSQLFHVPHRVGLLFVGTP